jgi:hypothetical protein
MAAQKTYKKPSMSQPAPRVEAGISDNVLKDTQWREERWKQEALSACNEAASARGEAASALYKAAKLGKSAENDTALLQEVQAQPGEVIRELVARDYKDG